MAADFRNCRNVVPTRKWILELASPSRQPLTGYDVIVSKEKSKRKKRDAACDPSAAAVEAEALSSVTHSASSEPAADKDAQKALKKAARKAQKHVEQTGTDSPFEVELMPHEQLLPHEQVLPERLEEMLEKIRRRDYFHKPVLVDRESLTILDGHHKWTAAGMLKLKLVPVVKVDYLTDERIVVEPRPESGTTHITKEEVVAMGRSETVYPPKSSRHVLPFELPRFKIPLKILR